MLGDPVDRVLQLPRQLLRARRRGGRRPSCSSSGRGRPRRGTSSWRSRPTAVARPGCGCTSPASPCSSLRSPPGATSARPSRSPSVRGSRAAPRPPPARCSGSRRRRPGTAGCGPSARCRWRRSPAPSCSPTSPTSPSRSGICPGRRGRPSSRSTSCCAPSAPMPMAWPDDHVIELGDFHVEVASACSGIEGLALVLGLSTLYALLFRAQLRQRRFWLVVVPIGLAASWTLNVLRIAALVAIGANALARVRAQRLPQLRRLDALHPARRQPALRGALDRLAAPGRRRPVGGLAVRLERRLHPALRRADGRGRRDRHRLPAAGARLPAEDRRRGRGARRLPRRLSPARDRARRGRPRSPARSSASRGSCRSPRRASPTSRPPPPSRPSAAPPSPHGRRRGSPARCWSCRSSRSCSSAATCSRASTGAARPCGCWRSWSRARSSPRCTTAGWWRFLAGVVFALLYLRRGRLADAIAAHVAANLVVALWALASGDWSAI